MKQNFILLVLIMLSCTKPVAPSQVATNAVMSVSSAAGQFNCSVMNATIRMGNNNRDTFLLNGIGVFAQFSCSFIYDTSLSSGTYMIAPSGYGSHSGQATLINNSRIIANLNAGYLNITIWKTNNFLTGSFTGDLSDLATGSSFPISGGFNNLPVSVCL